MGDGTLGKILVTICKGKEVKTSAFDMFHLQPWFYLNLS